jgi:hypothetical protein
MVNITKDKTTNKTRIDNYVLADVYLKFPDISTPYIQNKQTKTMTLYVSKQTQI